jgi:hypothetical protein
VIKGNVSRELEAPSYSKSDLRPRFRFDLPTESGQERSPLWRFVPVLVRLFFFNLLVFIFLVLLNLRLLLPFFVLAERVCDFVFL